MNKRTAASTLMNGLIAAAFCTVAQGAPIVTTIADPGGPSPTDMVNALLSGASGITIVPGSVSYTGDNNGSGTFTNGGTNPATTIGIDTGVILTSGDAHFVSQQLPNTNGSFTGVNTAPGSALLNPLVAPSTTFNASVLSFQFIPNGNNVQFTYVFGSEEYNNFVNTQFNDVFAFFVNGTNFALIPGTSTVVSINNVNCGGPTNGAANHVNETNCAFFRDNPPGASTIDTQLDGLTVLLSFVAPVNANVTNTIQLAIADTSDDALDSAVFIAGGTFQTCGGPGQPTCGGGGTTVPEPGSLVLTGLGLATLLGIRRKKRAA